MAAKQPWKQDANVHRMRAAHIVSAIVNAIYVVVIMNNEGD